jgi:hypothetical protein
MAELGLTATTQLPAMLTCPICHASSKLELRTHLHITCRGCGFIGDLIKLYGAAKSLKLDSAITVLKSKGALDLAEVELSAYMTATEQQDKLLGLIKTQSDNLKAQPHGSILAMLSNYGCRFQPGDLLKLLPHAIPLHRDKLDALELTYPKEARETLKWWGNFMSLAIPAYDGLAVVGFWLITPIGFNYLPLTDKTDKAVGFGLVPRLSDPLCFVTDNPIQALKLTLWSIVHTGKPLGFLVPYGPKDVLDLYKAKSVVYWSPEQSTEWLFRGLSTPGARSLSNAGLDPSYTPKHDLPCGGSYPQFMAYVDAYSKPAHQVLAQQLLLLPIEKAREVLQGATIEPVDKAKCLGYVNGEEAKRLSDVFTAHVQAQAITWNGSVITETPQGWVCKEKIISSAMIYMDEVKPIGSTGDAWITGSIVHNSVNYPFREKYSVIKKKPGAWLQQKVIASSGHIPYIDRGWTNKLVEISQQFRTPKAIMAGASYGWNGPVLQLPNFSVDSKGVYPSKASVEGPSLLLPSPLSDAEKASFMDKGVRKLYVTLLGGLVRAHHELKSPGILLTDTASAAHRFTEALGAEVITNADSVSILEKGILPIPLVTLDMDLAKLFAGPESPYVLAQASKATAEAAGALQDWVIIEFKKPVDFRVFRGIFLELPQLLSKPFVADTVYRDVANSLNGKYPCKTFFAEGSELDGMLYNSHNNKHVKMIEYLAGLVRKDTIQTKEVKDGVVIPIKDVEAHMKANGVKLPVEDLTYVMSDKGLLIGSSPDEWVFSSYAWNFYRSYVG